VVAVPPLPPVIPTVATGRLRLRPFRAADADDVVALAGDAEVARFLLHVPHPYPRELAPAWIATHAETWLAGGGPTWAVTTQAGVLTGTVSLRWTARHGRAELGFWLGRAHWGHGYGTEAARAAVDWAFAALGVGRVYAQHLAGNERSARVLRAAGLRFEGVRRQHLRKGGVTHDVHLYGRLRDDPPP
jgi:ribosomal-protein-alanine N-acetyltransferase